MHLEIERKFIVGGDGWRRQGTRSRRLRDGLVSRGRNGKVRVRVDGEQAWLTVKSARSGITRMEFEYEIPVDDAERLFRDVCIGCIIEKVRHVVPHDGLEWEVDVFEGPLEGLVWAEVELSSEGQMFDRPDWIGREVTGDPRFRQENLLSLCGDGDGRDALSALLTETSWTVLQPK